MIRKLNEKIIPGKKVTPTSVDAVPWLRHVAESAEAYGQPTSEQGRLVDLTRELKEKLEGNASSDCQITFYPNSLRINSQLVRYTSVSQHIDVSVRFQKLIRSSVLEAVQESCLDARDYHRELLERTQAESRNRFNKLVEKWKADTEPTSSISRIVSHPCYLKIIAMGEKALPLILESLADKPDHWFPALAAITDESPAEPGNSSDEAVKAWLDWGRREGLVDSFPSKAVISPELEAELEENEQRQEVNSLLGETNELKQVFDALVAEWRKETGKTSSSTEMAMHPAYQKIIGLGEAAIPLLLNELENKTGRWFWALKAITREDPVAPENRGRTKIMIKAWLDWGKEKGYRW
jgi:hypothetical protein